MLRTFSGFSGITACIRCLGAACPTSTITTLFLTHCRYAHHSRPLHLPTELNPARLNYSMEHAFEEPTFRFICEGIDMEFKNEVRETLSKLVFRSAGNFTQRLSPTSEHSARQRLQLFRTLCSHKLVSYAQVRSTPQKLTSFYETITLADPALALMAADHFTFFGLLATHADQQVQRLLLDEADSGKLIGCIAQRELIADEEPYNTEARYDTHERCFVVRGTGKFAIVSAEVADWAVVVATMTLRKNENHGTHAFLVPLREQGALKKGISVSPITCENRVLSECGAALIHFDDVRIPVHYLLQPFYVTHDHKVCYVEGKKGEANAAEVLRTRMRLATGALYVGLMKKMLTDVVHYVAKRDVCGPSSGRNYPFFGIQHVQTPLVSLVAKSFVNLIAWQRLLPVFAEGSGKAPLYGDYMKLAGVVHFLQEVLVDLCQYANEFMGVHAILASSNFGAATAIVQLRHEGYDHSTLIREVAFKSVLKNIGTTHWGWWLTSLLRFVPLVDRFIKNPLYSPRVADIGRHLIFFSHKHYTTKIRLRRSREIERRHGGSEHQWYDWVMFRHREVVHCGEAFMEMHFMDAIMSEMQSCMDPRGRKVLRDIGWIFALVRQVDRLDFLLSQQMLSPSKAAILVSHLDNLVTVLAPQCVNLVDAMQIPMTFRAPYAQNDMESYWTIPGISTRIQRGDKVVTKQFTQEEGGYTKEEQETAREEEVEFDLFHGLADRPSYASKNIR